MKKKNNIVQDFLNIIVATAIGAFSGVGVYAYTKLLFPGMIMSGLTTSMIIILMYSIERFKK